MVTFFPIADVPVFWPILLMYWFVLFFVTMKRQIKHMIKYRYIPFSMGKKVGLLIPPLLTLWPALRQKGLYARIAVSSLPSGSSSPLPVGSHGQPRCICMAAAFLCQ